jgi:hypothetical protein
MMKKICFSLILSVTASFLGLADVQYYENSSPLTLKATSGWGVNDNFYSGSYVSNNGINVETSAVSLRVGFDTDNLNMWVDRLTFNLAFSPKTMTAQIADYNGVLKSITTTIRVNPISIVCRDGSFMDANLPNYKTLFQGTGGAYGLNNAFGYINKNWSYNFSTPPQIDGTYTTTGPTETRNGSFSISLDGMYLTLPDFINLSKPSQEVVFSTGLSSSHLNINIMSNRDLPVIYSIVDNVNVVAGLNITAFQLENSQFTLQAIPEPSALSLFAVGLGGLAMIRRYRS